MDSTSENAFINSMKTHKKDRTMILISHKNSLLNITDRLILLEQGKIIIDGTKEEVVKQLNSPKVSTKDES